MKHLLSLLLLAANLSAGSEPATLETPTGVLQGTLELPSGKGPFPVVLMIAGSGPTDRDGNTPIIKGKNDGLKMIAAALASHGIASLRYDKRGIAASTKAGVKEEDIRFETLVNDAVLWGKQLRVDPRFGPLVVLGHSEGSLIGMIAARILQANGFVSLAGVGRPASAVLIEQMRSQLSPEALQQVTAMLAELDQGRTVANPAPALAPLFRSSVQPYLISWFKYDPAKEIAKLDMPVLIAQGTTDIQVSLADARLLAAAKPDAKLLIVENMNHVLKEIATTDRKKQIEAYGDPSLPVVPKLLEEIVALVKRAK